MIKQFSRFSAPLILWVALCSPGVAGAQIIADEIQLDSNVSSSSANFGESLDSAAGIVVVGAPREGTATGDQAGIVQVYEEMVAMGLSTWLHWTTVTPPDARAGANFGNAVAISGNWLMVGAEFDAEFPDFAHGKAYAFYIDRMLQNVSWVATLDPLTPSNFDQWGSKLALGTDFAYMGAENADRSQSDAGQVETFARTGIGLSATWQYQETLLGADVLDHSFGSSIATTMDGHRVIVGADGGGTGGAIYLFDYNVMGGYFDLTFSYSLPIEMAEDGDNFGTSIAISYDGLTAVVGADAEDVGIGKAWVLSLPGASMSFGLPLAPPVPLALVDPEGEVGEQFGSSVAIMGDLIAVGAEENNDAGLNSGAIFLFGRDVGGAGNWGLIEQANASNASTSDRFGTALSLQDDHLAVGAPLWRDPALAQSVGAAYVLSLPEPGATGLGLSASLTLLWLRRRRAIGVRR